jgi:hypothetical protein
VEKQGTQTQETVVWAPFLAEGVRLIQVDSVEDKKAVTLQTVVRVKVVLAESLEVVVTLAAPEDLVQMVVQAVKAVLVGALAVQHGKAVKRSHVEFGQRNSRQTLSHFSTKSGGHQSQTCSRLVETTQSVGSRVRLGTVGRKCLYQRQKSCMTSRASLQTTSMP